MAPVDALGAGATASAPSRRRHVEVAYEEVGDGRGATSAAGAAEAPPPAREAAPLALGDFAVLPEASDNCAILRCRLSAGARVALFDGTVASMQTTVLEGHRLAVVPIKKGEYLLSWGLPFGAATRDIAAGEYVCNSSVLATLRLRHVEGLPAESNFEDVILPHTVDPEKFAPREQVPLLPEEQRLTFMGYDRSTAQGGVGTRNFVAVIPTSALASPFARRLAESLQPDAKGLKNCDGVVALAHTEAAVEAGGQRPKNWELLLRTLAGFVSHPNVAAALVVGYDGELLTPAELEGQVQALGLVLPKWCRFLTLGGGFQNDLKDAREILLPWLPEVDACERTPQPLSHLRVALQCGGSDAFSGVSGNPAAGNAAKRLIEHGGAAVLAETDELIGAESYILSRVADLGTAQKFLHFVERFKERFSWHGQSAESNPSGGNKLRGLYNIALKSLGAAKKKHAEVALDGVLDYSERLEDGRRGYFFLDSPGNDLESIAGQVACGCNAIFFVTGNGSITNFPFVPTIKIITTSERYSLLQKDMDFNAGQFQDDGVAMDDLGGRLFADLVRVASGGHSVGERAGHSQVSIWREWAQDGPGVNLAELEIGEREGSPLALVTTSDDDLARAEAQLLHNVAARPRGGERLGLVLPTSLCSGEIARKVVDQLNASLEEDADGDNKALKAAVDRFVALPHTEGCGIGYSGDGEKLFSRVMLGHLTHTSVELALMLEHGCEKTHNAWMLEELNKRGLDDSAYGFASVQLDGGIDKVTGKVRKWFAAEAQRRAAVEAPARPLAARSMPVALLGDRGAGCASLAAALVRGLVGAGGSVIVPSNSPLLSSAALLDELSSCEGGSCGSGVKPSLAFAQAAEKAGAHVMHVPMGATSQAEVVTGLVAAGAGAVVVFRGCGKGKALPATGHPMVPVLHVAANEDVDEQEAPTSACHDLVLGCRSGEDERTRSLRWLGAVASLLEGALAGTVQPRAAEAVSFQVARGPTGVSA